MHPEPQSTRDSVTAIVAANALAAAPSLERLADVLEAMAEDIDRLAAPAQGSRKARRLGRSLAGRGCAPARTGVLQSLDGTHILTGR